MNKQEIQIYENISKIKINNAVDSINRKDPNYRLAKEIYESLYELKQENKEQYFDLIKTLKIKDVEDLINFKEQFIEKLPKLVVPNDYEKTVLNVVGLVKSAVMYYAATDKGKANTEDKFIGQTNGLEFLFLCQENIQFEYIGAAIGFAISGNLNLEHSKINSKKETAPTGNELWNALKDCNKMVVVDFNKIDENDIKSAISFLNPSESLGGAYITDGWFVDEKNKTIYPIFCTANESLGLENRQYFEKMAVLKKYGENVGYKIAAIYLTNSYFNESYNGDEINQKQQHSTDFLNSFEPKLPAEDKKTLNHSIFLSSLGSISFPNDIHPSLDFFDILKCNMFAVGSDTEELSQKFIFFNSLPSPNKEQEFFDFMLNKIQETLSILSRSNGMNASWEGVQTMFGNIDEMLASLDNFNLSNLPEGDFKHLSESNIEKMIGISKTLNIISKKTKSFTSTKWYQKDRVGNFESEESLKRYYENFYKKSGSFYDFSKKSAHVKSIPPTT